MIAKRRNFLFKKAKFAQRLGAKPPNPQFGLHCCDTQSMQIQQSRNFLLFPPPPPPPPSKILVTPTVIRKEVLSVCQKSFPKQENHFSFSVSLGAHVGEYLITKSFENVRNHLFMLLMLIVACLPTK